MRDLDERLGLTSIDEAHWHHVSYSRLLLPNIKFSPSASLTWYATCSSFVFGLDNPSNFDVRFK